LTRHGRGINNETNITITSRIKEIPIMIIHSMKVIIAKGIPNTERERVRAITTTIKTMSDQMNMRNHARNAKTGMNKLLLSGTIGELISCWAKYFYQLFIWSDFSFFAFLYLVRIIEQQVNHSGGITRLGKFLSSFVLCTKKMQKR
jgi:hypothetical protein